MLVKEARDRSADMAEVNAVLRATDPDWDTVTSLLRRVTDTVAATSPTDEAIFPPYLLNAASTALLRLWSAVETQDRRAARLAAEAVRQALSDLADDADRDGPRDAKRTAQWVVEVVGDLDGDTVQLLFGVSPRTWHRWVDPDGTTPSLPDAARLRAVAAALEHLRRAFTVPGALAWFARPHPHLDGRRPADLLDDPTAHADLIDVAAGTRVTVAS